MNEFLRYFLVIYFIIYFGITFVVKSVIVAKKIGKNPIVLPSNDNTYGLIGFYFKIMTLCVFVYVLIYGFLPTYDAYFYPIHQLDVADIKYFGISLLIIALIWTIIAQKHMKNSWRIGIDTELKTEMITSGIFQYSRNPIFLGMLTSLVGLFLTTPNTFTLLFLVLGYVLIQIQIRLEEEFLTHQHGQKYVQYRQNVRRFV